MAPRKDRQRLERTVALLQQKWGPDAIRQGGRRAQPVPHISTGFAELDAALGIGGIPRGRITLLTGAATSGKRTLAALVLGRAQAQGRAAAYVDLSHTCDPDYLERCGVRLRDLLVVRPSDGSKALELITTLSGRAEISAILFDHWGALAEAGVSPSAAAAMLGRVIARLVASQAALLVLAEPRSLWQRLRPAMGDALGHYVSLHLDLRREEWFKAGPDVRGYRAGVAIQKNKLGPSGQTVSIAIRFNGTVRGQGI